MDKKGGLDRWFLGAGQHHMGHGDVEHYWWAIAKGLGWEGYMGRLIHPFAPGNLIRKTSEFPAVFLWTKHWFLQGIIGDHAGHKPTFRHEKLDQTWGMDLVLKSLMVSLKKTPLVQEAKSIKHLKCLGVMLVMLTPINPLGDAHPVFNPPKSDLRKLKVGEFFWIHFTVRLFSHTFESSF